MKSLLIYEKGNKTRRIYAGLLGIILGVFMVFGFCLQKYGEVKYNNPRIWLALAIAVVAFALINYFFLGISYNASCVQDEKKQRKLLKNGLIIAFVFVYLLWFIQLIGVYPGYFNYDGPNQWQSYAESRVTAHHPYIHTYLVGWFIHFSFNVFKEANPGCFIFVLFQMLLTDFAFIKMLKFINRKKIHIVMSGIFILYFAVFPSIVVNVFSITKDSMFAPFIVLFVISTIEVIEILAVATNVEVSNVPVYKLVLWGVYAFFTAVLRNNATYIVIPFIIVLALIALKKKLIRVTVASGVVLICLATYYGPIQKAVTVEGVSEKEYLSVPCQQISRVYHLHGAEIAAEDKGYIESVFEDDALAVYIPKIADVAKGSLKNDVFDANIGRFADVWMRLGIKYPNEYFDAFFMGNYGFWYPFSTLALYANGEEGYFVTRSYQPTWPAGKIYKIQQYYERVSRADIICNNPWTMWMFAPSTFFYLHLFTATYLAARKKKEAWIFVPLLLIWLTFLLGPVALVRYVSYLYYLLPLEIGMMVNAGNK